MKIGVISDTHGYFDPAIPSFFEGVEHILHAGDIGPSSIIHQLEAIAPVTAVLGNNDFSPEFRETETVEVAGFKFLLHHIVTPQALTEPLERLVKAQQPHAVIFGHTHEPFQKVIGGCLFFNPGYSGRQRFSLRRSLGLLEVRQGRLHPKINLLV